MKNAIVYIVIILSYILLLSFSSLSGVQSRSNVFFSYLNGEIIFDYNPDMSLFHQYYSKISRFTQKRSKFDFLIPTLDINNDQLSPGGNSENILRDLNMVDSGSKWTVSDPGIPDLQDLPPSELFAVFSGQHQNEEKSNLNGDTKINDKETKNSFVTTPCGPCNNFPILSASISHLLDYSVEENRGGSRPMSDEDNDFACNHTPEPDTIFLFGSVLIGFIISTKILRRKNEKGSIL